MRKYIYSIAVVFTIATIVFANGVKADIYDSALVGWWNMDNNTVSGANLTDLSGNGNTGTITAGVTTGQNGHNGQSFSYDGTSGYINIGTPTSLKSLQVPLTITAWVKEPSVAPNGCVVCQYQDVSSSKLIKLFAYSASEFGYYFSKADGSFQVFDYTPLPTLNKWHFLSMVMSGTTGSPSLRLGADGIEETFSPAAMSASPDTTVPIFFMADNSLGSPHEWNNGQLDEVRIYNRALTVGEINQLYLNGSWRQTTDY